MKTAELKLLPKEELTSQLQTAQKDYGQYQEAINWGKEKNHARLKFLRRHVARIKTLISYGQ